MGDLSKPIASNVERIALGRGFDDLLALVRFLATPEGPLMLERMEEQAAAINNGLEADARLAAANEKLASADAKLELADERLAAADQKLIETNSAVADLLAESERLRDIAAAKCEELLAAAMETASALMDEVNEQKGRAAILEGENAQKQKDLELAQGAAAEKQADLDRRLALLRAATGD